MPSFVLPDADDILTVLPDAGGILTVLPDAGRCRQMPEKTSRQKFFHYPKDCKKQGRFRKANVPDGGYNSFRR